MLNTYIAGQIYAKISFGATLSQKKVVEKLSEYLSSSDYSRIFVLNGYAGTGKTTLISALVAVLRETGVKSVLLAPTGRAAKVLTRYSGQQAFTILQTYSAVDEDLVRAETARLYDELQTWNGEHMGTLTLAQENLDFIRAMAGE